MRFALLLVCVALSAQTPLPPGRGVNSYSFEKEKLLGEQLSVEYRRQVRVFDTPTVNAYLNELGQRLAAQVPEPAFTYTFELVDDDQTWIHEPAAFPGGPVFVPASLILAAAHESELAGMLAHAVAHVATRQETRQGTRGQIANQAAIPLTYMGGWSGYAMRQGDAVPMAFLAFQRQNEVESDRLAVRILAGAGYDPKALYQYIERVQLADRSPFPAKGERLDAIRAAIEQLPPAATAARPGFDAIQQEVKRLTAHPAKAPPRLAR